jgi:hypothetical protein
MIGVLFNYMSTDLLKALRAASKGLVYLSESDKPVKAFLWKKEDNLDALQDLTEKKIRNP